MRTIPSLTTLIACLALMPACGGGSGNRTAGPMPQGGTFTGVYHSPQYGEMHLVQTGNAIVGEYRRDERSGRIQGTANGNLMRFEWNEERELVGGLPQTTRGRGYFHYSIDEAGKHNILGEWGIDDSDDGGGAWNAYKLNRRSPELSSDRGGGATTGGENDDWDDTGETGGGSGGGDDWDDGGDSGSEDPGTDLDDLDL